MPGVDSVQVPPPRAVLSVHPVVRQATLPLPRVSICVFNTENHSTGNKKSLTCFKVIKLNGHICLHVYV